MPQHRTGQDHDGLLHRPRIEPALTAEEWAHPSNAQQIGWACGEVFVGEGPSLDTVNRHGLAALCLYGQPFGFTVEDVEAIEAAAHEARFGGAAQDEEYGDAASADVLDALAAKLRALLPA